MPIANALQPEATQATLVLFPFNYDAMSSLKSMNLFILPYYSVFAADTLFYAVTLTFDLANICRVSPVT